MSYDGWIDVDGREFINVARTARLAAAMGLITVRVPAERVTALEERFYGDGFGLGGFGMTPFGGGVEAAAYLSDITTAPWYDPDVPASEEFAGLVPLRFDGLEDSTLGAATVEYITDGGHSGTARNSTLSIVGNVGIMALSERGAEYGRRWMNRTLRGTDSRLFGNGWKLSYLSYMGVAAPVVHRRDVRLTRGASITAKRNRKCYSTWLATFTLTANDPYEYSSPAPQVSIMGNDTATGAAVVSSGGVDMVEESCPVYDYTPIYDPLHPALIAPPSVPEFLPDGWDLDDGMPFRRTWARLDPFDPGPLSYIPRFSLTSPVDARMVRVSVWESSADTTDTCGALFTAILTYLPGGTTLYLDAEQQAVYVWDGRAPSVRRADSLAYGPLATPLQWATLTDPDGLLITLDIFNDEPVTASLQFISKSD